jgi:hypothetical protein
LSFEKKYTLVTLHSNKHHGTPTHTPPSPKKPKEPDKPCPF